MIVQTPLALPRQRMVLMGGGSTMFISLLPARRTVSVRRRLPCGALR